MTLKTFHIPNISCGHCVKSIKDELSEVKGVLKVEGNPSNKEITVEYESQETLELIKKSLIEINFPPED
jgi:copper chaperone